MPEEDWPKSSDPRVKRIQVFRSRRYLVQIFEEDNFMLRMSACRSTIDVNGRWEDGLTWDELQELKQEVGFGTAWAMEIYPPSARVVNVANMRHLWIMPQGVPPTFGWNLP